MKRIESLVIIPSIKRLDLLFMMPLGMAQTFRELPVKGKIMFALYFIPINLIVLFKILFNPESVSKGNKK